MTAISLHIGLNQISPAIYGTDGKLNGCINDANGMNALALKLGYKPTILTDKQATVKAISDSIHTTAKQLLPGDIFLLTYSGHGSQLQDTNGDEPDGLDETWCLYDGQLVDDEIFNLFSKFRENVRIIVVSDSCHSGSVTRSFGGQTKVENIINKSLNCLASGILLSGCRDSQVFYDGPKNGLFTATLLKIWNEGKFEGTYKQFHQGISANIGNKNQSPCYFTFGKKNLKFSRQKPFMV
jgi:hypothetical protein